MADTLAITLQAIDKFSGPMAQFRDALKGTLGQANSTTQALNGMAGQTESLIAALHKAGLEGKWFREMIREVQSETGASFNVARNALLANFKASKDVDTLVLRSADAIKVQGAAAYDTANDVSRLHKEMSVFRNVLQGVAQGIGQEIWRDFRDFVHDLVTAIPRLVSSGQEWIETVRDIQQETGMTAEQTSTLVAVMQHLGIDTNQLRQSMAMLGRNLVSNEQLFAELGVATRDANGQFLSAYDILGNLRHRFSEAGASLQSTGAAQQLLYRSGYKLLDFLQLTDEQFNLLAEDARAAGLVLSQDVVNSAERMQRTWAGLWQEINSLAVQAFAALEPTMESFVANFSSWVRANLHQILGFIVSVVNFISGLIGGLLGFSGSAEDVAASLVGVSSAADGMEQSVSAAGKAAGSAAKKEDALTKALKAQIKAIDDKIKALRGVRDERDAEREQADLEQAIADARAELTALQESQLNLYGLSEAERVLALQKREKDLKAAQEKIVESETKLSEFQQDQALDAQEAILQAEKEALQERLKLYQEHHAAVSGGVRKMLRDFKTDFGQTLTPLASSMDNYAREARDAQKAGKEAAESVNDFVGDLLDFGATIGDLFGGMNDFLGTLDRAAGPLGIMKLSDALGIITDVAGAISGAVDGMIKHLQGLPVIGDYFRGKAGGQVSAGGGTKTLTPVKPKGGSKKIAMQSGGTAYPGDYGTVGEAGPEAFSIDRYGALHVTPMGGGGDYLPFQLVVNVGREAERHVEKRLALRRKIGSRRTQPGMVR